MKTTKELLGARIKELRKLRRLSQEQVAEKVNIDPKHLSRIEVGRGYPSLDTLEMIAGALGVEMKDFFEFTHHANNKEVVKGINNFLKETDDNKRKIILKIIRAIVR